MLPPVIFAILPAGYGQSEKLFPPNFTEFFMIVDMTAIPAYS